MWACSGITPFLQRVCMCMHVHTCVRMFGCVCGVDLWTSLKPNGSGTPLSSIQRLLLLTEKTNWWIFPCLRVSRTCVHIIAPPQQSQGDMLLNKCCWEWRPLAECCLGRRLGSFSSQKEEIPFKCPLGWSATPGPRKLPATMPLTVPCRGQAFWDAPQTQTSH